MRENRKLVAGNDGEQSDDGLSASNQVRLLVWTHSFGTRKPSGGSEHVSLKQILRVKGDIQQEPGAATPK